MKCNKIWKSYILGYVLQTFLGLLYIALGQVFYLLWTLSPSTRPPRLSCVSFSKRPSDGSSKWRPQLSCCGVEVVELCREISPRGWAMDSKGSRWPCWLLLNIWRDNSSSSRFSKLVVWTGVSGIRTRLSEKVQYCCLRGFSSDSRSRSLSSVLRRTSSITPYFCVVRVTVDSGGMIAQRGVRRRYTAYWGR